MIRIILSYPIAGINSSIELFVDKNEPCDLILKYDLDHIKLIRNNEVLGRISHDNTLFSVTMDPPMSLSCALNKISAIPCLSMLQSVHAPVFTIKLIRDYNIHNEFWVHRICITCVDLAVFSHRCDVPKYY